MTDPIAEFEAANPCKHAIKIKETTIYGFGPTPESAKIDALKKAEHLEDYKAQTFAMPVKTQTHAFPLVDLPMPKDWDGKDF